MPISSGAMAELLRAGLFVSFYNIDVMKTMRLILLRIKLGRKNIGKLCLQLQEFQKNYYGKFGTKYKFGGLFIAVKKIRYNKKKMWVAKKYGEDMYYMDDSGIPGLERDIDRFVDLSNKRNPTRKSKSSIRKLGRGVRKFDEEWALGCLEGHCLVIYEEILKGKAL